MSASVPLNSPRTKIVWKIFPPIFFLLAASVLGLSFVNTRISRDLHLDQSSRDLTSLAKGLRLFVGNDFPQESTPLFQDRYRELGRETGVRITLIRPDGLVTGDSHEEPLRMDNHGSRPEVLEALAKGDRAWSVRSSDTLGYPMLYVTVPVMQGERLAGVIRLSRSLKDIENQQAQFMKNLVIAMVTVSLLLTLICWIIAKRISLPLEKIKNGALRFASGELTEFIPSNTATELDDLSDALNLMAAELEMRMSSMLVEKREKEAIFSSMREGVIATDAKGRVIETNRAALDLIGFHNGSAEGLLLTEILRHKTLRQMSQDCITWPPDKTEDIEITAPERRVLQVHRTQLLDHQRAERGVLWVLNDVTKLRHLEQMRKNFVANVSHELRTPLTALRGFTEILADKLVGDEAGLSHFVDKIQSNTSRMEAIIQGLLTLSKMEQDGLNQEDLQLMSATDLIQHALGSFS
ncbi:MAG: PAS domain-containing protein, partial [Planctomycetes bacterium]|nr:PAS domain-containing protein [Planctomycetota bacterium]